MYKTLFILITCCISSISYSQIGIGTTNPHSSAILDIESTTKGFLLPRLTHVERNNIINPAIGLMIYNSDLKCLNVFNEDDEWTLIGCSSSVPPPPLLPSNVVFEADLIKSISSIYDEDYLPYNVPTSEANTDSGVNGNANADGSNESITIDFQGVLTTSGIEVNIPYTVIGGAPISIDAFSLIADILPEHTENNSSNSKVEFSYPAQTISGSGYIQAHIKSVGTDLLIKKLDINAGLGTAPDYGITLAHFVIALDDQGNTGFIKLKALSGIIDRNFSDSDPLHRFVYLPVVLSDTSIWLNNNLGANYSDYNNGIFNPNTQAQSATDFNAYGSIFQWGRKADGHELITYTTSNSANSTTVETVLSDNPSHGNFIQGGAASDYDWRVNNDQTLWDLESSLNNPCPKGYVVPTVDEFQTMIVRQNLLDNIDLKFSRPGSRTGWTTDGAFHNTGLSSIYWASNPFASVPLSRANRVQIGGVTPGNSESRRSFGHPVRCFKEL